MTIAMRVFILIALLFACLNVSWMLQKKNSNFEKPKRRDYYFAAFWALLWPFEIIAITALLIHLKATGLKKKIA